MPLHVVTFDVRQAVAARDPGPRVSGATNISERLYRVASVVDAVAGSGRGVACGRSRRVRIRGEPEPTVLRGLLVDSAPNPLKAQLWSICSHSTALSRFGVEIATNPTRTLSRRPRRHGVPRFRLRELRTTVTSHVVTRLSAPHVRPARPKSSLCHDARGLSACIVT